jgi:hypothetical protein
MYAQGVNKTLIGRPDKWCLAIGSRFGVTSSGMVTASAGYIGGWEFYTETRNKKTYTGLRNHDSWIEEIYDDNGNLIGEEVVY